MENPVLVLSGEFLFAGKFFCAFLSLNDLGTDIAVKSSGKFLASIGIKVARAADSKAFFPRKSHNRSVRSSKISRR